LVIRELFCCDWLIHADGFVWFGAFFGPTWPSELQPTKGMEFGARFGAEPDTCSPHIGMGVTARLRTLIAQIDKGARPAFPIHFYGFLPMDREPTFRTME
jgi:hypothetical protein